jgi:EAL domain-containing protein (putative c-di-GMP-specific phosphodiesterase class I)
MSAEEIVAIIRDAVHADRIDLYLQPIVTLPQRKVRFYEALSRMRLTDGKLIDAKDFIPHARAAGLIPQIDQRLVLRCVQVVRRLAAKAVKPVCSSISPPKRCATPRFFPNCSVILTPTGRCRIRSSSNSPRALSAVLVRRR